MNTEYKYQLSKRGKYTCPKCERKTFVLYIDNTTGEPLHSTVGKCDRADNCGHHYPPKQYFKDNNISLDAVSNFTPYRKPSPKPQPAPSFIDDTILQRSMSDYQNNTLIQYLCSVFGNEKVMQAVKRYKVGTAKDDATVFYQIDDNSRIRAGKIIHYKADGHRDKAITPPCDWVHNVLKLQNFNLNQCLFGLHLLKDSAAPIGIVESEKTALVASIYLPEYVWLATGGKGNLYNQVKEAADVLKGRKVVLFPDLKATDDWKKEANKLKREFKLDIKVSDLLEKQATEQEREQGLDLADFILREEKTKNSAGQMVGEHNVRQTPIAEFSTKVQKLNDKAIEPEQPPAEPIPYYYIPVIDKNKKWDAEIAEIEKWLQTAKLPAAPFRLSPYEKITDIDLFIDGHLQTIKAHNGNPTFRPYLDTIIKFKNTLAL